MCNTKEEGEEIFLNRRRTAGECYPSSWMLAWLLLSTFHLICSVIEVETLGEDDVFLEQVLCSFDFGAHQVVTEYVVTVPHVFEEVLESMEASYDCTFLVVCYATDRLEVPSDHPFVYDEHHVSVVYEIANVIISFARDHGLEGGGEVNQRKEVLWNLRRYPFRA